MCAINKVLVIDDEPDIRCILQLTLTSLSGWEVLTAGSGIEGLRRALSHLPDLILLDVMMPDMDGPETSKALALSDETRSIPVIFMTAKARFNAGRTIIKPFDPATLVDQINELLNEHDRCEPAPETPDLSGQLAQLWNRYRDDVLSKVDVIQFAVYRQSKGFIDDRLRSDAELCAHSLAGTAGVFGIDGARSACRSLEQAFEVDSTIDKETDLFALVRHIRDEFESAVV